MTTHPALVDPPSSDPAAAGEFSLAALMELFAPADPFVDEAQPSLRAAGARLVGWTQQTSRRAASWGAVPTVGDETTGAR